MKKITITVLFALFWTGCSSEPPVIPSTPQVILTLKGKKPPQPTKHRTKLIHETYIYGQNKLASGSNAALRVMVQGASDITKSVPIADAEVAVELFDGIRNRQLYRGKTGNNGNAGVVFQVPELKKGKYSLQITTSSKHGKEKIEQEVEILPNEKILLVTDKPVYQPGQVIHIRALALQKMTLKPVAGHDLLFEVEDSKGNKVFKEKHRTGDYGIAFVRFTLADEVNQGDYKIRVIAGNSRSEKTVQVKKYVLPKFKIMMDSGKKYFLLGDKVKGKVQADYFFGKPVSGAKVKISAAAFDVSFRNFFSIEGITGEKGDFDFELTVPDYLVGQPLEQGKTLIKIEAQVTDKAQHSEKKTITRNVAKEVLQISVVPESTPLRPHIENKIYLLTGYPDGSPTGADLTLKATGLKFISPHKIKTDKNGFAEINIIPTADYNELNISARDAQGQSGLSKTVFHVDRQKNSILLRSDKAVYRAGDSIKFSVFSNMQSGTVYLDLIKEGQTVLIKDIDLNRGQGKLVIHATPEVFGTLRCHAYKLGSDGNFIRDTRFIYVQPTSDIEIAVRPDKSIYKPGEQANIEFITRNRKGHGIPAALSIAVVDEAVFALQEMQPGLAKLYFTLEKELAQPKLQVRHAPPVSPFVSSRNLASEPQKKAKVAFACGDAHVEYNWKRRPDLERKELLKQQLVDIFQALVFYAEEHPIVEEKADGSWQPVDNLLTKMEQSGNLSAENARSFWGDHYKWQELAALDKSFSHDILSTIETARRINKIYLACEKSELPETGTISPGKIAMTAQEFIDGWGREMRCTIDGNNQFPYYKYEMRQVIVTSCGIDGKFGTADDIRYPYIAHLLNIVSLHIHPKLPALHTALPKILEKTDKSPWDKMREERMAWETKRRRHRRWNGDGMVMPEMAMAGDPEMAFDMPATAKIMPTAPGMNTSVSQLGSTSPPPRVREYFPETLLFEPRFITGAGGKLTLPLRMADSITTWRLTAGANSQNGLLGGITHPIKVFQDFFVDIDFPVALTQNDEVSVPIAVYNYLPQSQNVRLVVEKQNWFELLDQPQKNITMKARDVGVIYFRLRARKTGNHKLTVQAYGDKMNDAVRRQVEITPDGKKIEKAISDTLQKSITHEIDIPEQSISDASKIMVKCTPGITAVLLDGLDGMLRLPGG